TPPVPDDTLGRLGPRSVVAIERSARCIEVELRTVEPRALAEGVEDRQRGAAGVGVGLQHERRYGADEHGLGDAAGAVLGDVAGDLAATGGVADVDGVAQVEVVDNGGGVGGVGVHV